MTKKLDMLDNKIVFVRPISFYSKLFSTAQVARYCAMEKEIMAFMFSLAHFRDIFESVPLVYILTDSQPLLWLLRHRDNSVKLMRYSKKILCTCSQ
jgi:RNase H-like domain found in reverse transcriptase